MGHHYLPLYGAPGAVNSGIYSHGQMGHHFPGDNTVVRGYGMLGHHIVPYGGPNDNGVTSAAFPMIQPPYATGNNLFLRNLSCSAISWGVLGSKCQFVMVL